MIDFTAYREGKETLATLGQRITPDDLRAATDAMIDEILAIIGAAVDADVDFVPSDPAAKDTFGKPEEEAMAWTLGHVVVHAMASSEEAAALAAELARGIEPAGRSRYEVAWQTVHTVAQLRDRLAESRRMRLAYLTAWPDAPHLDITYAPIPSLGPMNAVVRFMLGLMHEESHLAQLREIMRQSQAARAAAS